MGDFDVPGINTSFGLNRFAKGCCFEAVQAITEIDKSVSNTTAARSLQRRLKDDQLLPNMSSLDMTRHISQLIDGLGEIAKIVPSQSLS